MKRILAFTLAVLMMAAVLVACGGSNDKKSDDASAKSVDLNKVLGDINSQYDISESTVDGLKKLETNAELDRYYMIAESDIKQFAAERSSSSTDFTEIVLVEANDSAAVDKIVTQLNSRLDAQRSTAKSYTPEAVAVLESCSVKTNGNFIYLVISDKADGIVKLVEDALK
ncbi:MAG: DUF4358 domain-containing protein [Ruminococcus sp.]|nr:DUF4358 domain-containing protein [Ruminococcus sp.]MBQ9516309.1 DUF4358 domain-containing protein [Ruminococcus sp.]